MKAHEISKAQEQLAIQLKPIISYPRVAEIGESYLLTIDVQLAPDSPWPYTEEEFEISFVLETAPFFIHEPLGEHEPGIVLHRFGGTYGPAEYLLTASEQEVAAGEIKIALLNGWGLPIARLELECEVKLDVPGTTKQKVTIQEKKETLSTERLPTTTSIQKDAQRALISKQLIQAGWHIYDEPVYFGRRKGAIPDISIPTGNVVLLKYPGFENDYLLCIDTEIVGIVKVDATEESLISSGTSPQRPLNIFHSESGEVLLNVPFVYDTTGDKIIFTNYLELSMHKRVVYSFHQPATLTLWLIPDTSFRASLRSMPILEQGDLYDHQFEALQQIEQALFQYDPRILIQIETNRGKTHTAVNSIYRLLRYAHARHILYIVDTPIAVDYAFDTFQRFIVPGDNQKFTELYDVSLIGEEKLDPSVHVYIGIFEDLYNLYSSGWDREHHPEPILNYTLKDAIRSPGNYYADLPIEYFDVIFLAESEYIHYKTGQYLLDYFDTFFIGIASKVSDAVLNFFNNNIVYGEVKTNTISQNQQDPDIPSARQEELSKMMWNILDLQRGDNSLSDSIERLVWLLFLKYLDDFEVAQEALLGASYVPIIGKGYRWRDWAVADSQTHQRKGDELLKFVKDDLFRYLSGLIGEDNRDMRTITSVIFEKTYQLTSSGDALYEIVDKVNGVNFNSSADFHAMSITYETILERMYDSSIDAAGWYTPRPVVRFIIDCLNPQLGESVLDPVCGSAGFLVEAFVRQIHQVKTPEQLKHLVNNLIGIEKKPISYLLATMNMLLHGIDFPNVFKQNVLTADIQHVRDDDDVDIIATNPPFGEVEKRDVVNKSTARTSDVETAPLLVQYIMTTLKRPGGRCAIVLPNGFLFRKGATGEIRRRLLTQFNLHTIVRLPTGIFAPYTSIPTNILFFEASEEFNNADKQNTKAVWYYEIPLPEGRKNYTKTKPIQYADFHDCLTWWDNREENEHAWQVTVKQLLADDCNLDRKNPRGSKTT